MVRKSLVLVIFICILCVFTSGCSVKKAGTEKLRDLEFTVVENDDIPEELMKNIESKKEEGFKITYADNGDLYISIGYGKQETGGYSIAVNDLYLSENAIYFNTSLIGPSKEDSVNQAASYPYIVVKTEYIEKNVIFQ